MLTVCLPQQDLNRIVGQFAFQQRRSSGSEASTLASTVQALLDLRSTLSLVPAVRGALAAVSSPLLSSIRDTVCSVPALSALAARIEELLDEEVCSGKAAFIQTTQQVFAIRTGVDGFLDVGARETNDFWCRCFAGCTPD